ncbi:MAG: hypothetical protein LQ337_005346 [Flavoplaca oasis]|nr:MAG: hypothetical protein LQ337_005346 [Flavoplaca oasis]
MVGNSGYQAKTKRGPVSIYVPSRGTPRPKQEVTKAEDAQFKQLQAASSRKSSQHPPRPGYGLKGDEVTLRANFFEFVPPTNLILHRYAVSVVEPQIINGQPQNKSVVGKKLKQVFRLLLECQQLQDYHNDIVTDFKAQIISRVAFNSETLEAFPLQIQYRAEFEDDARPNAPLLDISITRVGPLAVADLFEYLTSTNSWGTFDKQPILQALNIFLGHYAKQCTDRTTIGGRSFIVHPHTQEVDWAPLQGGLRAVRGFFSSLRFATSRILVNVNVTNAAFYNPTTLKKSMIAFGTSDKGRLQSFLKRVRVQTSHLMPKENAAGQTIPVIKTIFALANTDDGRTDDAQQPPPQVARFGAGPRDVKFWMADKEDQQSKTASLPGAGKPGTGPGRNKPGTSTNKSKHEGPPASNPGGRYISVDDYFQSRYRKSTDPNMPVVNVGTRTKPSYLPVEVCSIVPGQMSQARLNPAQADKMIKFAVRRPFINAQFIDQRGPDAVGLSPGIIDGVSRFGVNVGSNTITVPGRILRSPDVQYSTPKGTQRADVGSGSWNMITRDRCSLRFNIGATVRSWHAVFLSIKPNHPQPVPAHLRQSVMAAFDQTLRDTGINVRASVSWEAIEMESPNDPALMDAMAKCLREHDIMMIILPIPDKWLYDRIKKCADLGIGLHTICVLGSKLVKVDAQYRANVAHKFNLKLGGVNQKLDDAKLGFISEGTTMIVGIDVTHPSPGSAETAPSVAGMVASVDARLGQWPAILRIQSTARQEDVSQLDFMLKTRLILWFRNNNGLPRNILIYRDGVGDTQYDMILQKELPLLRKACSEMYGKAAGPPNITIVVVGKRHHARFFATETDAKVTDQRNGNPRNGTVVDRHITEVRNWDFYLQSHAAIQGTARPAHYFVVLDEIFHRQPLRFGTPADLLEEVTHNLCYVFGRATKAVSICTPVYYAHLVCERARCYLTQHYAAHGPGQGGLQPPTNADIRAHDRLKDQMFYI